jgi:hypothetical protein
MPPAERSLMSVSALPEVFAANEGIKEGLPGRAVSTAIAEETKRMLGRSVAAPASREQRRGDRLAEEACMGILIMGFR